VQLMPTFDGAPNTSGPTPMSIVCSGGLLLISRTIPSPSLPSSRPSLCRCFARARPSIRPSSFSRVFPRARIAQIIVARLRRSDCSSAKREDRSHLPPRPPVRYGWRPHLAVSISAGGPSVDRSVGRSVGHCVF
jgi:hypothetical protein